jgi:glucose/arabinose dehydrogenase
MSSNRGSALRLVAGELSFPTSLAFADDGTPLVAESGLPFGGARPGGRVLRLRRDGWEPLADGFGWPVNGLTADGEALFVSEGGPAGQITRIGRTGALETVLDCLPGPGNYHTNMTAIGPDGRLYFSQGALTNTGVVGLDAYEIGWLGRLPHGHDIPGLDIVLTGLNVRTPNPLVGAAGATAVTGAFHPFAHSSRPGERVPAGLPCTAAMMSCRPDGGDLRLVAWGLRNAYGLAFLPDGRLLATDQGADQRGSRPIADAPDLLFEVTPGLWYGWPDFVGGIPITDERFRPAGAEQPRFVLANHDELPALATPLLSFPPHSAALKMCVLGEDHPAWPAHILVALFGDERPMTAPDGPTAGRSLARIDPSDWSLHQLVAAPLHRPIDVRHSPADDNVYVLDFGQFEMGLQGNVHAVPRSGALWRLEF